MGESLMKPENLIFKNDPNFPAIIDYGKPGVHGELHTGDAFQGYMGKIPNPDETVVFSIIIFGDGTVVDGAMRKSIEPYSFTLGIFQQHACENLQHGVFYVMLKTIPCVYFHQKK